MKEAAQKVRYNIFNNYLSSFQEIGIKTDISISTQEISSENFITFNRQFIMDNRQQEAHMDSSIERKLHSYVKYFSQ